MTFDQFDCYTGLDSRYHNKELNEYLSYRGYIKALLHIELMIVKVFSEYNIAGVTEEIYHSMEKAVQQINIDDIVAEESRIHHDIRAVVNCVTRLMPENHRFAVHLCATSYDIIDTANSYRFRKVFLDHISVKCDLVIDLLTTISNKYKNTPMIGRTHLQEAIPITFGGYVNRFVIRLEKQLEKLSKSVDGLMGKFAGPVGNHAALSLYCENPREIEDEIMNKLDLFVCHSSSQIVDRESYYSVLNEVFVFSAIINDLATGLRLLASDAIDEVREKYDTENQVGSSSMPHKRNPISLEKISSIFKVITGLKHIAEQDICSWLDRDLSNSLSGRTYGEILAYFFEQLRVLVKTLDGLVVHEDVMMRNLINAQGKFLAEPLYCILASVQYPNAHEKLRQLSITAREKGKPVSELFLADVEIQPYLGQLSTTIRGRLDLILKNPANYLGTYG